MDFYSRLTIENSIWVIFETDELKVCSSTELNRYMWPTCLQVSYFKSTSAFMFCNIQSASQAVFIWNCIFLDIEHHKLYPRVRNIFFWHQSAQKPLLRYFSQISIT